MKRLPQKQEAANAFLSILALIHSWALVILLYKFPGLIQHLTTQGLLSVSSYVLVSAFVESLAVWLGLLALAFVLPDKFLRQHFSIRSTIIIILSMIYIFPFHKNLPRLSTLIFETEVVTFIALWTGLYIAELIIFNLIPAKYPRFTEKAAGFVERIAVLGALYLFLDVIAFIAVLAANWS